MDKRVKLNCQRLKEAREYFLREFNTMVETLKPQKVYVYGNEVEGLKFKNIEYIKPFTRKMFDNG